MNAHILKYPLRVPVIILAALVLSLVFVSYTAFAAERCLGDSEEGAGKTENATLLQLTTGNYQRPSKKYYWWKSNQLKLAIAENPNQIALYDELAFLQGLRHKFTAAKNTLAKKESRWPNKFSTAVIQTKILLLQNKLAAATNRAIEALDINPNAELDEVGVIRHVLEYIKYRDRKNRRAARPLLQAEKRSKRDKGFLTYLKSQYPGQPTGELRAMMLRQVGRLLRCGYMRKVPFIEVFGDLLQDANPKFVEGPKMLAARAYLRASLIADGLYAKEQYRKIAKSLLSAKGKRGFTVLKKQFLKEYKAAKQKKKKQLLAEKRWIKEQRRANRADG